MPTIRHIGSVLLAATLAAACDIPTELPKWDSTFVVKAEGTSLSVGQILPSSVTVANGGSAFALSLSPATFSQSLGTLCPACGPLNGQTAPKPAFNASFGTSIALPADVSSGALASGTVNINVQNGFSFDPLRPNGSTAPFGSLTITIKSGTTTVGTKVVDGSTTALPANTSTLIAVPLSAGTISGTLDVTVNVNSPQGGNAQINTSNQLTATATPTGLLISSVQARVSNRQVSTQVQLNVSGIDNTIIDHLDGGSLILTINNPFGVTGTLNLTITGGTQPIIKQVTVAAGTSTVEVPFTATELKSFLGHSNVTLAISGPVNAAAPVTVTPSLALTVTSQLKLLVGIGA